MSMGICPSFYPSASDLFDAELCVASQVVGNEIAFPFPLTNGQISAHVCCDVLQLWNITFVI